ncbi:solute carrier family 12 member 8 isoform X1 [Ischnura elegans]|uniref:solute carrier family 12 member 8 isoform X1 n=1 Tax=Ischnura elegans TaxID=197161 RepID=UPI001ED8840E|nr:solute carrier family 12 member 8 isoform X1 [Ischnura elegans]XP_046383311.1 solute carrier family 12 member 8 isoform X1 [Ischnura elegans]XP_046383312.1 solute carrier family 12 member 8 isoform X1 [Ischnura elegans]XP_046383313.1 solute carrier family 12 member 8 isoform X1 [Ischnura elegans]XP_046383314.1 solute carrier family 12 member 8 isoform X1 [Ischnura elegans]XP_046383315.1 solute carrier family 12 member 8 isoform X1 [Ischnura elegans]
MESPRSPTAKQQQFNQKRNGSAGGSGSVDWGRYGLGPEGRHRINSAGGSSEGYSVYATGDNELFAQERGDKPWWKSQFFISEPVLFGTWDGVFTSCLINIFGVIVFLRSGWIVGQAGVLSAIIIIFSTVGVVLVSVLSAVGICERCRVESGGVYFLLAHVLGARLGGAIGILYVFGQAVGCALNVTGFGESVAKLVGLGEWPWAERGFSAAAVLLLGIINVAGVKWVVKLQFALLIILLLGALDFAVGSFVHVDPASGFDGWLTGNFMKNTFPGYQDGNNWFTVFGIFFPTVTGVMAGINMSGDLRHPSRDIPNGTLSALGTGTFLYLLFVLFLGCTCERQALLTDFMLASKVSALQFFLLAGLYVSSMSSCLGAMYGTPRVLQSIANENVIPGISFLGRGRGPNRVPVHAMALVAIVTLSFILVGQINTLAPIVTMPFLLTYAAIDYAYFALAQTFEIQMRREERFRSHQAVGSPTFQVDDGEGGATTPGYGSTSQNSNNPSDAIHQYSSDLDKLFPERVQHQKLTRQHSSPTSSAVSSPEEPIIHNPNETRGTEGEGYDGVVVAPANGVVSGPDGRADETTAEAVAKQKRDTHIRSKSNNWYSSLCNRWMSLIGALVKLLIMFLVNWVYALVNILVVFLVWFYVGRANPAVTPGLASQFRFLRWLKNSLLRLMGKRVQEYEQIVVTPLQPDCLATSSPLQLTEENEDFASRRRYHQSSTVQGHFVNLGDEDDDDEDD